MLQQLESDSYALPHTLRKELPVQPLATDRMAVILNQNANKVNDRVRRRLAGLVPSADLYYSRSLEEAEGFARHIVQAGYGTVVSGGGDGTLVNIVNQVCHYVDEANEWRMQRARHFGEPQALLQYPEFGVLKLGTGNGLSHVVGASNPAKDLHKLMSGPRHPAIEVDLIECEGTKFMFGGIGYDARILNDYIHLKQWAAKSKYLKRLSATAAGYLLAVCGRSVPDFLRNGFTQNVRVTSEGDNCYYMDSRRGDRAISVPRGTVLFEGPAGVVSVGTSPYFGFGFTMFPFAGTMPGLMNLRIATMGPLEALSHLPSLWNGNLRSPSILDFMCDKVKVETDKPVCYQHSGDGQGKRDVLNFAMSNKPLKLVDYYGHPFQNSVPRQ